MIDKMDPILVDVTEYSPKRFHIVIQNTPIYNISKKLSLFNNNCDTSCCRTPNKLVGYNNPDSFTIFALVCCYYQYLQFSRYFVNFLDYDENGRIIPVDSKTRIILNLCCNYLKKCHHQYRIKEEHVFISSYRIRSIRYL